MICLFYHVLAPLSPFSSICARSIPSRVQGRACSLLTRSKSCVPVMLKVGSFDAGYGSSIMSRLVSPESEMPFVLPQNFG